MTFGDTLARVPEILEVESYRQLADRVVGATIVRGWADGYLAKKLTSAAAWASTVKDLTVTGTGRRGKLLLLETSGPTLGVRFGMTGVLLLDGDVGIEGLFYGPHDFRRQSGYAGDWSSTTDENSSCTIRGEWRDSRLTPTSADSVPTRCR